MERNLALAYAVHRKKIAAKEVPTQKEGASIVFDPKSILEEMSIERDKAETGDDLELDDVEPIDYEFKDALFEDETPEEETDEKSLEEYMAKMGL